MRCLSTLNFIFCEIELNYLTCAIYNHDIGHEIDGNIYINGMVITVMDYDKDIICYSIVFIHL